MTTSTNEFPRETSGLPATSPTATVELADGGGVQMLETVIGCTLDGAFALLSGRGVLSTNCPPAQKNASQPETWRGLEGAETAR